MINVGDGKETQKEILIRLNRIEGQIKGIQKMIMEDKICVDVLTQVAATRSAINKVGGLILENHTKACMLNSLDSEDKELVIKDLVDTIQKFLRFVD